MVCYLVFKNLVKKYLKNQVTDSQAEDILRDIESEVGHDMNLIKTVVVFEGAGLAKRLKKKKKREIREVACV